jgi:hypothetical protein
LAHRNQELDADQAAVLARQVVNNTLAELQQDGKVRFEE